MPGDQSAALAAHRRQPKGQQFWLLGGQKEIVGTGRRNLNADGCLPGSRAARAMQFMRSQGGKATAAEIADFLKLHRGRTFTWVRRAMGFLVSAGKVEETQGRSGNSTFRIV